MIIEWNHGQLGLTIRRLRKKHRMSRRKLAEKTGISTGLLVWMESGCVPVRMSADTLRLLAQAFQISVELLTKPVDEL